MVIRKNDSGRSIVEMLGVLAIMGVITVMGIQGYSQAVEKINRNKTVETVTKIVQEVRALYATTDNYDGLGNKKLEGIGLKLAAPYGGNINVEKTETTNPGFSITVPNIPRQDCIYYSTMTWADVMTKGLDAPHTHAYFGANNNGNGIAVTGDKCQDTGLSAMTLYYR